MVEIARQEFSNVKLHSTFIPLTPKWDKDGEGDKIDRIAYIRKGTFFLERWMNVIKPLADNNLFSLD